MFLGVSRDLRDPRTLRPQGSQGPQDLNKPDAILARSHQIEQITLSLARLSLVQSGQ